MLLQSILTLLSTVALIALAFFKNIKFPQLNDQTISSRSYDASKNVSTRAMYKPGFSVAVPERCPNLGKSMDVMILVASERNHFQERMAIRNTWGNVSQRTNVGIVFFIGASWDGQSNKELEEEKRLYGDIVQGRYIDTNMYNSTLKGVSMLEWVQSYCSNVTFLLRCDDRTFINVPNLLSFVQHKNGRFAAIYCSFSYFEKPERTKGSDAYVSEDEYNSVFFPKHCIYEIYLMPAKVVQNLYAKALNERYFKREAVFLTGIVAKKLGLPQADEWKQFKHHFFANRDECRVKEVIAVLEIYYENQMKYWLASQNNSTRCYL